MKTNRIFTTSILIAALCLSGSAIARRQNTERGVAVAFPWAFSKGTPTARETAWVALGDVLSRAAYRTIPIAEAKAAWKKGKWGSPTVAVMPKTSTLRAFGRALKADKVIYGSVSWHTRSIWVNAGPKTISTATVTAMVFDVKSGKISYRRTAVKGRSDERSSNLKIAAAILFTPLVTAVSGGPATPREQRAAQISIALAFQPWIESQTASMKK